MQEISCIICGRKDNPVFIKENGYDGLRCESCKLIYISPRPEMNEIINLYAKDKAADYADSQYGFESITKVMAKQNIFIIQKYKKNGSVLEIGTGSGQFLEVARKLGYDPYGIELNIIEANWIKEKYNIPCESDPLNENSFGSKTFDIIYHRDVLSHLYDPIGTFHLINNKLNEGGLQVFETGNIGDLSKKQLKWFANFNYPDHLFFFGEESIIKLLNMTGFELLGIYKRPLMLSLLLEKMLWKMEAMLKDRKPLACQENEKFKKTSQTSHFSIKRKIRLAYKLSYLALMKANFIFFSNKRFPLKLIVISRKKEGLA